MNNKLLIGLVVVLLGLGIGWYVFRGQSVTPSPSPTPAALTVTGPTGATESGGVMVKASVNYTDQGFLPNSTTVKVGTAVTFVNQSSRGMWVASAVHPTHQLLPGFDELASVSQGGSYQYTFIKVGTWKYHNHLNPSDTGVVVVTP